MKKVLFLNSASGAFVYFVNIIAAFILSPVIVEKLGNHDYGIWEIMLSLCGYMGILDLGVSPAVVRYIAREQTTGSRQGLNRIFNSSLFCLVLIGSLAFLTMLSFSFAPDLILGENPAHNKYLKVLFVVTGCNLWIEFSATVFTAYLMGLQQHYFVNTVRIIVTVVQGIITYLALTSWGGSGLLWVAALLLAGNLIRHGAHIVWIFSSSDRIRIGLRFISFETMKELYLFGFKSCLLMVSDRVQRQSVPIIIGQILDVSQVVFFAIPRRLVGYAKEFGIALGFSLMPYFSSLDARCNKAETEEAWYTLSRCIQFVTLPIPVVVFLLGEDFIYRWIGPLCAEQGRWVIRFLAVSLFIEGMAPNAVRYLVGSGKHGRPAMLILAISIIGVLMNILFTQLYGIPGVALSLMILDVVNFLITCAFVSRALGISTTDHMRATVVPVLLPLCLMTGVTVYCGHLFGSPNYTDLLVKSGFAIVTYLTALWFVTLNSSERKYLVNVFKQAIMLLFSRGGAMVSP